MSKPECRHTAGISSSRLRGGLDPKKTFTRCEECGDSTDNWLCLTCFEVRCGRTIQGHMESHCRKFPHPLVIALKTMQIWCYACEQDLDQLIAGCTSEIKRKRTMGIVSDIRKIITAKLESLSASIEAKSTPTTPSPSHPTSPRSVPPLPKPIIHPPPVTTLIDTEEPEEEKPIFLSKPVPKGLTNLGNTCYFNVILQCLAVTQPLLMHVNDMQVMKKSAEVNIALGRSLKEMKETNTVRTHSPNALLSSISSKFKQFRGYGQHDSHELLRCLLDSLSLELSKSKAANYIESVFKGELLSSVLCLECVRRGKGRSMTRTCDPVMDVSLEIVGKRDVRIEGFREALGHWKYTIETEDYPQAQVNPVLGEEPSFTENASERNPTVLGCLGAFTRCEGLLDSENLYDCLKCQTKSPAIRRLLLSRPPKVLVIHLKRFTNSGPIPSKLSGFVPYPAVLDLSPYCVRHPRTVIPTYRLYALAVHCGGLGGGHYVACVEVEGVWYHCNDSRVTRMRREEAMNQDAYLLFYQAEDDLESSTHGSETSR